jgi:hypothetical protein
VQGEHSTLCISLCHVGLSKCTCVSVTCSIDTCRRFGSCAQVVHCLALAADMSGDSAAAIRWLEVLTSLVPHDPGVLCKLGAIYHRCGRVREFQCSPNHDDCVPDLSLPSTPPSTQQGLRASCACNRPAEHAFRFDCLLPFAILVCFTAGLMRRLGHWVTTRMLTECGQSTWMSSHGWVHSMSGMR